MTGPLLLDTGGWLWALEGRAEYAEALYSARPAIVPALVLAEVDWHLRCQRRAMQRILKEVEAGAYVYEAPTVAQLWRSAQIDRKFADLNLGLVDCTIASLAEYLGVYRILTIDSDFAALRVGRGYRQAFEFAVALP